METNIKLTALRPAELVVLLRRSGSRTISEESLRRDIENGAPVNDDGTVSLIAYGAWLAKETDNAAD